MKYMCFLKAKLVIVRTKRSGGIKFINKGINVILLVIHCLLFSIPRVTQN